MGPRAGLDECEKSRPQFFFIIGLLHNTRYKVYKDKLQNCSCNQFRCIGTCNQVETNSMTNNRGGNKCSEK